MPRVIRIGTSGWHYAHWKGPFYPKDVRGNQMLPYYAEHLDTVEINNSFYRLPARETFTVWARETPPDFIFAVKASRYITHLKRLKDAVEPLDRLLEHASALGSKLGPLLFQLPPRWRRDSVRLEEFLASVPRGILFTFEFRDPSWFHSETYRVLSRYGAAFCAFDLAGLRSPRKLTSHFGYLRLHGPSEFRYAGRYTRAQLRGWLGCAQEWLRQGARQVFIYFDNDEAGYAAINALELQRMVEQA